MFQKKRLVFLLVVVVFLTAVFIIFLNNGKRNPANETFFSVKRGDNVFQIANNLKTQGYINSRLGFIYEAFISDNFRKMKAGRYEVNKGEPYKDLIEKFVKGQSLPVEISVISGKTIKDIATILESKHLFRRDDFLNFSLNPGKEFLDKFSFLSDKPEYASLEGYLFPDNYLISPSENMQEVSEKMLNNFDKKFTQDLRAEIKKQNRNIFQVVIMASMIEKEVKEHEDKQLVAGILWKRADNNLPLEVDSTLLYFQTSTYPSLLEKDVDSQYNTYKYAGLPKGPICTPSLESIKAAIYPKASDYWFYLSSPEGETIFAKTLGQQLINKAKYLSNN